MQNKKVRKSKTVRSHQVTTKGPDGEIKSSTSHSVIMSDKGGDFVKLYFKDMAKLFNVQPGALKVLLCITEKMGYDGMYYSNKTYREQICATLKIEEQSFKNYVRSLVVAGILKRPSRGVYMIDPNSLHKGDWRAVLAAREEFSLVINYNPKSGRTIEVQS